MAKKKFTRYVVANSYSVNDSVLPIVLHRALGGKGVKIEISVNDDCVTLRAGPRDFSWDRETAKFIGAGTML